MLLEKGVQIATRRLPKVISPGIHAVLDLAVAGSFLVAGVLAWKRGQHKVALSSWMIAGTGLGLAVFTNYPAGIARLISLPAHGKIDAGMSGLIGALPTLMDFGEEDSSRFFRWQAVAVAAVVGLTDFSDSAPARSRSRHRAA